MSEWIASLMTGVALLVLLAPVIMLLATAFILVPLAHLAPRAHPSLARLSLVCPSTKRSVTVAFLSVPDAAQELDVESCSTFGEAPPSCAKGCLGMVDSHATPPLILARYALLDSGEALRDDVGDRRAPGKAS